MAAIPVRSIPGVRDETEMFCWCEAVVYAVPWSWVRTGRGHSCGRPTCQPPRSTR